MVSNIPPVRGSEMHGAWPIGDPPEKQIADELVKIHSAISDLERGGDEAACKETIEKAIDTIYTLSKKKLSSAKEEDTMHLYGTLRAQVVEIFKEDGDRAQAIHSLFHTIEDFHAHVGY